MVPREEIGGKMSLDTGTLEVQRSTGIVMHITSGTEADRSCGDKMRTAIGMRYKKIIQRARMRR